MTFNRSSAACFSGYRPKKFNYADPAMLENISVKLAASIFLMIDKGYNTFLFGGAPGFDILAARAVNYAKAVKKDIHLVCVLPYSDFHLSNEFDDFWRRQYLKIIPLYYNIITQNEQYHRSCYMDRNKYMIDHSSQLICLFNGTKGGTYNTIEYAKSKDVAVVNLLNHQI